MSTTHQSPAGQQLEPNEFLVVLDYTGNVMSAQRVLEISADFLDALEKLDSVLLGSLSESVKHWYGLEGLTESCIRIKLAQWLARIDDKDLRDLNIHKMRGEFLVWAKSSLLRLLGEHPDNPIEDELDTFSRQLPEMAAATQCPQLQEYLPPDPQSLAEAIQEFLRALQTLREKAGIESIKYACVKEGERLNTALQISQINIDHMFKQPDGPTM